MRMTFLRLPFMSLLISWGGSPIELRESRFITPWIYSILPVRVLVPTREPVEL